MSYEKVFTPQYQNGWKNKPNTSTPVIAEALNGYDEAIEHIEDYLYLSMDSDVEDVSNLVFTPAESKVIGSVIIHKYGKLVRVERLKFNNVVLQNGEDVVLAAFNEGFVPVNQSYERILWNATSQSLSSKPILIGFISGETGIISIRNNTGSTVTTDIFVFGFSYLIGETNESGGE